LRQIAPAARRCRRSRCVLLALHGCPLGLPPSPDLRRQVGYEAYDARCSGRSFRQTGSFHQGHSTTRLEVLAHSEPNSFRMIQISICIKAKDLKSFVFTHFHKNREGVVDTCKVTAAMVFQKIALGSACLRTLKLVDG